MRALFHDPGLQAQWDKDGWVKVPLLSAQDISELERGVSHLVPRFSDGFNATFSDLEIKATASKIAKPVLTPRIKEVLRDCPPINFGFFAKGSSERSELRYHQHMNFTDEMQGFPAIVVWCPLVDTDVSNGTLHVVSGTHRLPKFPRIYEGRDRPYYSPACWETLLARAVAVPVKAGEAILFDNSLIHGSPPNRTPRLRIVATALAIPAETSAIIYYPDGDGRLVMCAIDEHYMSQDDPLLSPDPDRILCRLEMPKLEDLEQRVYEALGIDSVSRATPVFSQCGDSLPSNDSPPDSGFRRWLARFRR